MGELDSPSNTSARSVTTNKRRLYGFPEPLMDLVDRGFPGNSGPCGVCGDTIIGGRHRVIDAIAEQYVHGYDPADEFGVTDTQVTVAVAASYEHAKALAVKRRADRKAAKDA